MNRVDWPSVRAVQLVPPLVVFQTPPPAAAMYRVLGSVGSAATAAMRPETFPPPGVWPAAMGSGPSAVQVEVLRVSWAEAATAGAVAAGKVRLSVGAVGAGRTAQGAGAGAKAAAPRLMEKSTRP